MSAYLITGLPGSGKTAIGCELQAMGYTVIHADEEIVDPRAGWNWDPGKLNRRLVRTPPVFVCGGADNQADFFERFRKVFVLQVPEAVMQRRLASRGTGPKELKRQPLSVTTTPIDASKPVRAVVHEILRKLG